MRVRTRVELAELHQRIGTTMIYVTHDQTEAMTMADRIVILNNCRIEQVGTPMEVYSTPASRFVAGFIGSPAMNFVPVVVTQSGGRTTATLLGGGSLDLAMKGAPPPGKYDLGIRPEAVMINADRPTAQGMVKVVEHLGDRTMIYAVLDDGTPITAQDGGRSQVQAGDTVPLAFDTGEAHLFGADSTVHHLA